MASARTADDALVVALDRAGFSDLMQDAASTFGLQLTGRAQMRRGSVDDFVGWEPVLRCLLDGRPVYEPGTLTLQGRDGSPLDVRQSFRVDDDPADIGHFLSEAGFLHLEGVFTEAEMAAVSRGSRCGRRSGRAGRWRVLVGPHRCRRVVPVPDPRLQPEVTGAARAARAPNGSGRSAHSPTTDYLQRDPDRGDAAEGLLKKVGVVEGISDVSWHKDCSMGGHSRTCCSLVVGISVTGADRRAASSASSPGSHRANVVPLGVDGIDLPRLALPTQTGDITVHCSCTLHMSRPPVSAERQVVYTGFDLAPIEGDEVVGKTESEIRRERAALNDQVLDRQRRDQTPTPSFDL